MTLFSLIDSFLILLKAVPIMGAIISFILLFVLLLFIKYLKNEPSSTKRIKKIGFAILFLFVSPPVGYFFVNMFYPIFF